jgi:hypothetical protein
MGNTGNTGSVGPTGPKAVCDCSCVQYVNTFINQDLSAGPQGIKIIYNVPKQFNFIVYGYDSLNVASNLYIRTGETPGYENGIGFVNDLGNDNEIDTLHYVQIDLGDFIRVRSLQCADPVIAIGSVQVGEGFAIYGSNTLGQKGTLLYSYTNTTDNSATNAYKHIVIPSYNTTNKSKTGDLYLYGATPFRYISVTATVGNITLNSLTFNLCCREPTVPLQTLP